MIAYERDHDKTHDATIKARLRAYNAKGVNLKTIDLGTCDFQGRPFYERFGFKVIHTRDAIQRAIRTTR